jgi:hypothetical protein
MLTPFIIHGDIEITRLIPEQKVFFVIIHLTNPYGQDAARVQSYLSQRIFVATKYLIDEGYIADPKSPWTAMVSSVCHPV